MTREAIRQDKGKGKAKDNYPMLAEEQQACLVQQCQVIGQQLQIDKIAINHHEYYAKIAPKVTKVASTSHIKEVVEETTNLLGCLSTPSLEERCTHDECLKEKRTHQCAK